MIFETLAAMADLERNNRIDNNATREDCQSTEELLQAGSKLSLVSEVLTCGSVKKVVDDASRFSHHIYAIQKKSAKSLTEQDLVE